MSDLTASMSVYPIDRTITTELPAGSRWERMGVLYEQVASAVADRETPVTVVSGHCTTSLETLAGLQRGGHNPGIVWFDAHADLHTETAAHLAISAGDRWRWQPVSTPRPCPPNWISGRRQDPGFCWLMLATPTLANSRCSPKLASATRLPMTSSTATFRGRSFAIADAAVDCTTRMPEPKRSAGRTVFRR
jgi:hypothetical protein